MKRPGLHLRDTLFIFVLSFFSLLSSAFLSASDRDTPPAPPATGAASPKASQEKPSSEHIKQLLHDGAWPDAEAEARRLLTEAESASGSDSLEAARVLDLLVETLWRGKKARNPEARALAERAVTIKERHLGSNHPDLATSLKNLGNVCLLSDDLDAAAAGFQRMIAISEAAMGPDHREVANGLNNLAAVAYQKVTFPVPFPFSSVPFRFSRPQFPRMTPL